MADFKKILQFIGDVLVEGSVQSILTLTVAVTAGLIIASSFGVQVGISEPQAAGEVCTGNRIIHVTPGTYVELEAPGGTSGEIWKLRDCVNFTVNPPLILNQDDDHLINRGRCEAPGDQIITFTSTTAGTQATVGIGDRFNDRDGCYVQFGESVEDNPNNTSTLDLLCDNDPTDSNNFTDGPCTNSAAILQWSGSNLFSCTASTASASSIWNGSRPTSGPETIETITTSRTYTLTCVGTNGANVSDSVVVMPASTPDITLGFGTTTATVGIPLTIQYQASSAPAMDDWIALYPQNEVPATAQAWSNSSALNNLVWKYLNNTIVVPDTVPPLSGSVTITIPTAYADKTLVAVYHRHNTVTEVGETSDPITVVAATSTSPSPTPTTEVSSSPSPTPTTEVSVPPTPTASSNPGSSASCIVTPDTLTPGQIGTVVPASGLEGTYRWYAPRAEQFSGRGTSFQVQYANAGLDGTAVTRNIYFIGRNGLGTCSVTVSGFPIL